ncbi:MAG: hypothetical protein D6803_07255 [Anaerolineae bacterium]|nr:MAG: hypothetical protein D6803_07255 [Anaerolineae bacterium]
MENLLTLLADQALPGEVQDVLIGLNWTAVVVEHEAGRRCGLAATLNGRDVHGDQPEIPGAGALRGRPVSDLLAWLTDGVSPRKSLAMAALNAALPPLPFEGEARNAVDLILQRGRERRVALVGHFPFTGRLRARISHLDVLEKRPRPGDLPAEAADRVLPRADLVVITAMTLMNHTFEGLLRLCNPEAQVMLLGPSTPLSPLLFDLGVTMLAGAQVRDIPAALRVIAEGGNFRQVRRAGVDLLIYRRA